VFLVSLNIASKLEVNMFVVVEMFAGEKVAGRKGVRHAVSMWERIEPKYSITDQAYDHETWDLLKREGQSLTVQMYHLTLGMCSS
jgi:hypothetical protein